MKTDIAGKLVVTHVKRLTLKSTSPLVFRINDEPFGPRQSAHDALR